jgi:hypothetical protein
MFFYEIWQKINFYNLPNLIFFVPLRQVIKYTIYGNYRKTSRATGSATIC